MLVPAPESAAGERASNRYFDGKFGHDAIKLLPGQYFIGQGDIVLVTVLGSCVSACLRDPLTGIGGMNPFHAAGGRRRSEQPDIRVRALRCLCHGAAHQ